MSLEERLKGRIDEKAVREQWTQEQVVIYKARQFSYLKNLFIPILQIALQHPLSEAELFNLYFQNNSNMFSRMYMLRSQQQPNHRVDPTYETGIRILIKAYAQKMEISESQAGEEFLNRKIFEDYNKQYHTEYKPYVRYKIAKDLAKIPLAA